MALKTTNLVKEQVNITAYSKSIIEVDGLKFKDLNSNGELDIYEDWRETSKNRAEDLEGKMTLEEKIGLLVGNVQKSSVNQTDEMLKNENGILNEEEIDKNLGNTKVIQDLNIRFIINNECISAKNMADWVNELNKIAEKSRLGIPVVVMAKNNGICHDVYAGQMNYPYTLYPNIENLSDEDKTIIYDEMKSVGICIDIDNNKNLLTNQTSTINFVEVNIDDEDEELSKEKLINYIESGKNIIINTNYIDWIKEAIENNKISEEKVNDEIIKILIEMFDMGIFENPYVDSGLANENVASANNIDSAYQTHINSVEFIKKDDSVELLNEDNSKTKIYVLEYGTKRNIIEDAIYIGKYKLEIVDDYNDADFIMTYISSDTSNLKSIIGTDYDKWKQITSMKKNILIINNENQFIINKDDEVINKSSTVIEGFYTFTCAILDQLIIR
jgi:hypothetical protein